MICSSMSTVFLPVGQCGNQIARQLYEYIDLNEGDNQTAYLYKSFKGKYRSVNLDSEIKVINGLYNSFKTKLKEENLIYTKCGRGKNWAAGFAGLAKDGSAGFTERTMDVIRKEAESCDFLCTFFMLHSLSGGTGSGYGSHLMESVKDEFGYKKYMFNCAVGPFHSGETPLQCYNNLLCMSYLHEYSDMIILYQNDDLIKSLSKRTAHKHLDHEVDDTVSLSQMNSYLVKSLFSAALSPVDSISMKKPSIGIEILEMHRLLASNNNLKIVELLTSSEKTKGEFIDKTAKDLVSFVRKHEFKSKTINSLVVLRGNVHLAVNNFQRSESDLKKVFNCVDWNPFTIDYWCSRRALVTPESSRLSAPHMSDLSSLTVALNRSYCIKYLNGIKEKSTNKYKNRAYLHWYSKYGIDEEYFEKAFDNINTVIDAYTETTK